MSDVPRLVLDTNACLDLFVFNDRVGGPLRALLEAGRVQAVTDADCRAEWHRVLRYAHLGFEPTRIAMAEAAFDAWVADWPDPSPGPATIAAATLPRCRDPDDQKFLELAARCAARVLVTRDASLLRLSRRTLAAAAFVVLSPQATVALLDTD
jgi:predicted nucleic acid-binding protein